jgi:hypothetical protein
MALEGEALFSAMAIGSNVFLLDPSFASFGTN